MKKEIRIFLIGLMGSGKTHWGKIIADQLGCQFIDLDRYIEEREGKSIGEIFERFGERHFRTLEAKYLRELESLVPVVVAAGGGTPCFHGNVEAMNKLGETYYLKSAPETVADRLKNEISERPLLNGKTENELVPFFMQQLKERESFYLKAKHIIDADNLDERELKKLFPSQH